MIKYITHDSILYWLCKQQEYVHFYFSDLKPLEVFIKCGEWDTQQEVEPKKHQSRQAKQITIHPGFYRRGVHNDLAVIHLQSAFQLDEHISPICLPTSKVWCDNVY